MTPERIMVSLAKLSAESESYNDEIQGLLNSAYANTNRNTISDPVSGAKVLSEEYIFTVSNQDFLNNIDRIEYLQSKVLENCATVKQLIASLSVTQFTPVQAAALYTSIGA